MSNAVAVRSGTSMSHAREIDLSRLADPFPEDDIEWRIGRAEKKNGGKIWAKCLAYVSARAIMARLDEVCGPENWKVSYRFIPAIQGMDPGVISELSIRIDGVWITKEDGAEQTDIESFKGGISSALKRAGSVWGIGRYLYGLEEGWATITNDSKGAKHGKTKDGTEFYWLPPGLPAWALPAGSATKPTGIHPDQPKPSDGHPPDPDDYLIPFGTFKKKRLQEIDLNRLRGYTQWLIDVAEKKGKPLDDMAAEFVDRASKYIADFENAPLEREPGQDD